MQNVRQFSLFQCHHSKCRMNLFLPLLFVSLPICIWVDMPPKREKSRKKWQNIFLKLYFAWCSWQNDASSCFSFLRTRVRARLPTAMLIFCCHICHTQGEKKWGWEEQIVMKGGGKSRINSLLLCCDSMNKGCDSNITLKWPLNHV